MPYLIETYDAPERAQLRPENRAVHLDYLAANASLLLACGAKLDEDDRPTGGIYLVDLDTREQAQQFIDADPFSKVGLFREVVISRWRKAFLDGECFVEW